jgi:hypothetical protein
MQLADGTVFGGSRLFGSLKVAGYRAERLANGLALSTPAPGWAIGPSCRLLSATKG